MAEGMTELQVIVQERQNTGTAWTRNESFEKNGYLVIKDLWDPEELYHPVPPEKGQYNYWDKNPEHFNYTCLLYTSPSPRDRTRSRMPSSA